MYITSINVHSGCETFILSVQEDAVLQPWEILKKEEGEKFKDHYQDFFWTLIHWIVEFLTLIINPFNNQTER